MGLFDRFKKKASSGTVIGISGNSTAIWPNRNYEIYCKETYLKNVIAYRCIDEISKSVGMVPWKVYKKLSTGYREEITNNPLLDTITRPNPGQSFATLMQRFCGFLLMAGNSYMRRIRPLTGENKQAKELYVLRPDKMLVLTDDEERITGYKYRYGRNNSKEIIFKVNPKDLQSDILHLKLFHPIDDFYGAAVTEPAAREIDTSNEATEWNFKLLQNECRPGFIFSFNKELTDTQKENLKIQLKEDYTGSKNSHKSLVLDGADGAEVKPFGFSPSEMDFLEGGREVARKICLAYGVPPMILGIPGDNTYSNYQEARLAFWEGPVDYYLRLFKGEFNNWLLKKEDGIELDFVLDDMPAVAIKEDLIWKRANESNFITINEKREMVGKEEIDGGDSILIPLGTSPLGEYTREEETFEEEEEEVVKRLTELGKENILKDEL